MPCNPDGYLPPYPIGGIPRLTATAGSILESLKFFEERVYGVLNEHQRATPILKINQPNFKTSKPNKLENITPVMGSSLNQTAQALGTQEHQ